MSEGLKYFVNNDGTEVLFDPLSGKYYSLISDDQLAKNVNQQHQALNQSRGNRSSVKSSSHQSNRTVVQKNSNYHQKQQKQATTWQKNSEQDIPRTAQRTIVLTEQTSTPRETEQVQVEENEEKSEEKNEEKNEDNGIETQMIIENFQRQEQAKTTSSTLKHQATSEFQGNNQNGHWETVQPRRNNKRMNTGNDIDYRQHPRTFSNSNQNNNVNFDGRQ